MNKNLRNLKRALDDCTTSTEYLDVIHAITRTQDPDAIEILASLLDSPGPVGAAAVEGLISFGQLAESAMRRCVARSMDEDQIRNAHRVLAALGDGYSRRAVRAYCWADLEEEDAIAAGAEASAGANDNGGGAGPGRGERVDVRGAERARRLHFASLRRAVLPVRDAREIC
jgi:hypothetical protein